MIFSASLVVLAAGAAALLAVFAVDVLPAAGLLLEAAAVELEAPALGFAAAGFEAVLAAWRFDEDSAEAEVLDE